MKIARKISPMIRMGVNINPETQGNPQGNPIIRTKPEKIIAQTNKAKMMPNTGDPSLKGP